MSQQERWDVAIRLLDGPLASMGESVYRGPTVRIGANPGPGGVMLQGYRGLDPRHCTITAYTGGTAAISPLGTNQVRMAPHPNVKWSEIDPISGPQYLSEGCAIHIGPVNRGATFEFIECRRLGMWETGGIRSDVERGHGTSRLGQELAGSRGYGAGVGDGALPAAYDARRVGKVRSSGVPPMVLGCASLMMSTTALVVVLVPLAVFLWVRDVDEMAPTEDEYEFFESVDISKPPPKELMEGLRQPMYAFVMAPNINAAGDEQTGLDVPENWDQRFVKYMTKSVERHVRQRGFFKKLESKRKEYAFVTERLRRADLPEVFAAIPYQESLYDSDRQSFACAKGYWQFMPEVAHRVNQLSDIEFQVRDCRLRGRKAAKWNPTQLAPATTKYSEYIEDNQCLIQGCAIDDRVNLEKSTDAAIFTLSKAWNDREIRRSGSAVQITILSHNAGYNDEPYLGRERRSNLLPALRRYRRKNGADTTSRFYGDNILCADHQGRKMCGGHLMPETQHYAYNIVAQHVLAVCYYGKEYPDDSAFRPWRDYVSEDGYCQQFKIPAKAEVRAWK